MRRLVDRMHSERFRSAMAIVVTNGLAVHSALAETITVCADGCDHTSIQAAIDAASDGDVIQLAAETYAEGATINTRGKAIQLLGAVGPDGEPASILDGGLTHRVLTCEGGRGVNTVLRDLQFVHGNAETGGGLFIGPEVSALVERCWFVSNHATWGGGVTTSYSNAVIQACVFRQNTTHWDGAGLRCVGGTPWVTLSTFEDNSAGWAFGGGIANQYGTNAVIESCSFVGNHSGYGGGGISNEHGSHPVVHSCEFRENSAGIVGHHVYSKPGSTLTLSKSILDGCCGVVPPLGPRDDSNNALDPYCDDCRGNVDCVGNRIDASDLGYLLGRWGSDDPQSDLNGDGRVDAPDLGLLLGAWGDCK